MQDAWTDRLSEYLDGELTEGERAALESHLRECPSCGATLDELRAVVERAGTLTPRPPATDLWDGIAGRIGADAAGAPRVAAFRPREPRRISFTLPQLAAAAVVLAVLSGGIAWRIHSATVPTGPRVAANDEGRATADRPAADDQRAAANDQGPQVDAVNLADDQYDAAVSDLERALKNGRGRLDAMTVAIVRQNLNVIDQAIEQARQALAADPANSYLSTHLVETRRRKLDLLRRATALVNESN
jgi:putative zinc finger protein